MGTVGYQLVHTTHTQKKSIPKLKSLEQNKLRTEQLIYSWETLNLDAVCATCDVYLGTLDFKYSKRYSPTFCLHGGGSGARPSRNVPFSLSFGLPPFSHHKDYAFPLHYYMMAQVFMKANVEAIGLINILLILPHL